MKNSLLALLLAIGLLSAQCTKTSAPVPASVPQADYDQRSADIIGAVSPAVAGDWTLRRVHITAQHFNGQQKQAGIRRDTVLVDLATLALRPAPASRPVADPRYAAFTGVLRYRARTYPVRFELLARPERVVYNTGPQAFFLLRTDFPAGTRASDPEEAQLRNLGLLDENFTLETAPETPRAMTWRGLSHGISKLELAK